MTALIVTEECGAETIAVTITKKMQHIYFPCSSYPRHISLLIFPSTCLTTTVKQHKSEWTYPIFLDFICWDHFFAGSCHTALRQTRNKFAAPAVSFKRIWHNISNVYLPTCDLFGMTDTNRLPRWRSKRVSKTALAECLGEDCLFLWVTRLFLVKLLFDYSKWIEQFPYFRIQPQTIRGSWE